MQYLLRASTSQPDDLARETTLSTSDQNEPLSPDDLTFESYEQGQAVQGIMVAKEQGEHECTSRPNESSQE
jgi:hypothetical protein